MAGVQNKLPSGLWSVFPEVGAWPEGEKMALQGADAIAAAMPRLMAETELQKMLADERMRAEQHKNHYQALKTEHTR